MPIKDPQKRKQQARRWHAANMERARASGRAWKNANPEKVKENAKRYYQKNKVAIQERRRSKKMADPEAARARLRAYRAACPHVFRNSWLRNQYGIEQPDWDALFEQQGRRCAICRTDDPGGSKGWHTDHDHNADRVRGILCRTCNTGLGKFRDDPERLKAAIRYLQRLPRR